MKIIKWSKHPEKQLKFGTKLINKNVDIDDEEDIYLTIVLAVLEAKDHNSWDKRLHGDKETPTLDDYRVIVSYCNHAHQDSKSLKEIVNNYNILEYEKTNT